MNMILASTSSYRAELLQRLQIPFRCEPPNIDETGLPNESASAMVARLALAKAQSISSENLDAYVIGSDQIATLNGKKMGKPGSHEAAMAQLDS